MQPDYPTVSNKTLASISEPRRTNVSSFFNGLRWLGIGALAHAFLIGPMFDPNSLWSWGYLIAWPIPLAWLVLTWIGAALIWIGVVLFSLLVALGAIWAISEIYKMMTIASRNADEANQRAAANDKELG